MAAARGQGARHEVMQHDIDGELDAGRRSRARAAHRPRSGRAREGRRGRRGRRARARSPRAVGRRRAGRAASISIWREIDKQLDLAAAPVAKVVPAAETARAASESIAMVLPSQAGLLRRIAHWLDRKRATSSWAPMSAGAVAALALVDQPAGRRRRHDVPDERMSRSTCVPRRIARCRGRVARHAGRHRHRDAPADRRWRRHATVIWVTPADTVEGI